MSHRYFAYISIGENNTEINTIRVNLEYNEPLIYGKTVGASGSLYPGFNRMCADIDMTSVFDVYFDRFKSTGTNKKHRHILEYIGEDDKMTP